MVFRDREYLPFFQRDTGITGIFILGYEVYFGVHRYSSKSFLAYCLK